MDFLNQKVDNLKIIVFDLDYTLWPFWVDTHVSPPFRCDKKGNVFDRSGQRVKHYPEVSDVLEKLTSIGYSLGIASRTGAISEAQELLKLFGWDQYFQYKQIFPGKKTTHFQKIHKRSGVLFEEMLFFDDEFRNIRDLKTELKVVSILVEDGVDKQVVSDGIKAFVQSKKS